MYHKLIFYSGQKLKKGWTYPFVALWIWTLIPSLTFPNSSVLTHNHSDRGPLLFSSQFISLFTFLSLSYSYSLTAKLKPLHSKLSIDASEHPRLRWAWRSSAELDGRRSTFEDPARDRGWFAADPALPTQHCRPSPPRSRFESHFHPVNGFWFLFYVFVFRHQSGKPIFA